MAERFHFENVKMKLFSVSLFFPQPKPLAKYNLNS